jgi:hypothetical protein
MPAPTPSRDDSTLTPVSLPHAVGVYERPRTAWLREHLALLIGLFLSLIGLVIYAFRHWV